MTRESVLIALGVLIGVSPYLGIPLSMLGVVLPVLGLIVIAIGVMLRRTNQLSLRHAALERSLRIHEPSHEAPEI